MRPLFTHGGIGVDVTATAPATPRVGIGLIGVPASAVTAWAEANFHILTNETTARAVAFAARAYPGPQVFIVRADALDDERTQQWLATQKRVLVLHTGRHPNTPAAAVLVSLPATIDAIMGALGAPAKGTPASQVVIGWDGPVVPEPEPAAADEDFFPWDDEDEPAPALADPFADLDPVPATSDFTDPFADLAPATVATGYADPFAGLDAPIAPPAPVPVPPDQVTYAGPTDADILDEDAEDLFPEAAPVGYQPPPPRLPEMAAPLSPAISGPQPVPTGPQAPIIFVVGAKGGVAKSTTSMSLAEHAGSKGGIGKVVLVDMNRGQGGLRINLRLAQTPPSVYDAAITRNPAAALVPTKRLNAARPQALPSLHFGVVLAPPPDKADPSVVTADVYRAVIEHARQIADLVVVDTQIVEAHDTSGLFDQVAVPMLRADAFAVMCSDGSLEGVTNAQRTLRAWSGLNVPHNRLMVMLTRFAPSGDFESVFKSSIARLGEFVGSVPNDPAIKATVDAGAVPNALPSMSAVLDEVLHVVTGLAVFGPDNRVVAPARRPGFLRFGRRKGE